MLGAFDVPNLIAGAMRCPHREYEWHRSRNAMKRIDSIGIAVCAIFVGAVALVNAQTEVGRSDAIAAITHLV